MKPARLAGLVALAALPAFAQDKGSPPEPPLEPALELVERRLGVMGTELHLTVLGEDRAALEATLDAAEAELRRVEDVFTSWRDSELTRLNAAAGKGPFKVSGEHARLVARALKVGEVSGGAFDITFASVGKLWDFKADPPKIPSAEAIESALQHVGYAKVKVSLENSTIELPAGTQIGLGGVAKGYGVDRAMQVYLDRGVKHGMVNAGGDLKALGLKRGEPWEIAIKHPRDPERVLAVIPVSNACVVTSGDYERFVEHEGKRYHHILDPRTGYPSTGCMSATVIAPDAALADALATALCVLGPEKGLDMVNGLERVEALVVGLDGEVHRSKGLPTGKR